MLCTMLWRWLGSLTALLPSMFAIYKHGTGGCAVQLKISMLESQATDQAAISRRRMEEQTVSFKGEAAMAR